MTFGNLLREVFLCSLSDTDLQPMGPLQGLKRYPELVRMLGAGVGYHQIRGEPRETIRKGDVVKCPPDKVHWHGASENSSMTHIYIIPNKEKGVVE